MNSSMSFPIQHCLSRNRNALSSVRQRRVTRTRKAIKCDWAIRYHEAFHANLDFRGEVRRLVIQHFKACPTLVAGCSRRGNRAVRGQRTAHTRPLPRRGRPGRIVPVAKLDRANLSETTSGCVETVAQIWSSTGDEITAAVFRLLLAISCRPRVHFRPPMAAQRQVRSR
jgi:hypothetical protein